MTAPLFQECCFCFLLNALACFESGCLYPSAPPLGGGGVQNEVRHFTCAVSCAFPVKVHLPCTPEKWCEKHSEMQREDHGVQACSGHLRKVGLRHGNPRSRSVGNPGHQWRSSFLLLQMVRLYISFLVETLLWQVLLS